MATAKKAPAKRAATKSESSEKRNLNLKGSANKAVNVYLGLIGKSLDIVEENVGTVREQVGTVREQNEKRVKDLEKRGIELRKDLEERMDNFELPSFDLDDLIDDAKTRFNKMRDRVRESVNGNKERNGPGNAM